MQFLTILSLTAALAAAAPVELSGDAAQHGNATHHANGTHHGNGTHHANGTHHHENSTHIGNSTTHEKNVKLPFMEAYSKNSSLSAESLTVVQGNDFNSTVFVLPDTLYDDILALISSNGLEATTYTKEQNPNFLNLDFAVAAISSNSSSHFANASHAFGVSKSKHNSNGTTELPQN